MRKIKFRAWDEVRKEMHSEFNFIQSHGDGQNWIVPLEHITNPDWLVDLEKKVRCAPHIREQFKLMQFTGLLDKNGKEVYEGDIVKCKYGWLGFVVYRGSHYWCEEIVTKKVGSHAPIFNEWAELEIIGNIYENPELVNK